VAVNVITCLGLLLALQQRLGGLPLRLWGRDTLLLLGAAVLAGLAAWGLSEGIGWPTHLWGLLLQCGFCSGVGLLVYGLLASWAGVPEARELSRQLRQRVPGLR
jgi:putative peptidoglycan lipid II flippase